jgi:short-subunit dehydrogenase
MTVVAGSVCLVTGATGGIGKAIVGELRSRDAIVVATGRDRAGLSELDASGAMTIEADLLDPASPADILDRALSLAGRIDVLVNCAGMGWAGEVADMPAAEIERLIVLDLQAPVALTRAVLGGMRESRKGHIVNIASIAGHTGVAHEAVYSAAKAGLVAFSDALRLEVAADGIAVTLISPGVVRTEFFTRRGHPYGRSRPRPIGPDRVARVTADAIESERAQVFIPGWLGVAARLRGAAPGLYRMLARRFG